MSGSLGLTAYQLAFQVSPIVLTSGIATFIPGGMLPIVSLTQSIDFVTGLLSGNLNANLDSFFAQFAPLPGATLIDNRIGTYPFANQAIAANAIITQPLVISMQMLVPAKNDGGAALKLAAMQALKRTLDAHNNAGGTYIVATPSYFYTNCIMTSMRDVSSSESKQVQFRWQLDFVQPLVSLQQVDQLQNAFMSKITAGLPTDGALSGASQTVNFPPSLASVSQVPAATALPAAGTAPLTPVTSSPLPSLLQ